MTNLKRLLRVEVSLTPKQIVLLWLVQEQQGKTSEEYVQWMLQRPPSAAPRPRVGRQVADSVRSAMKGRDAAQIDQAVRQAQIQADFLVMLVNRTNWVILDDSQVRWLKLALLNERLRSSALADDEVEAVNKWMNGVRAFAIELFSLQAASELVRDKYFDGQCILLKDAIADLEQQRKITEGMMGAYDHIAREAGVTVPATDSQQFNAAVRERAAERADYIVALAKSKTLDDFGESEAADSVMKPYFPAPK